MSSTNDEHDAHVARRLPRTTAAFEKWRDVPLPADAAQRETHLHKLSFILTLKLGLYHFRLGSEREVTRQYFDRSAGYSATMYSERGVEVGAARNPLAFLRDTNVAICFAADPSIRRVFAGLERHQYDDGRVDFGSLPDLINALQRYLGEGEFDRGALAEALERLRGRKASKRDLEKLAPIADGLLAVVEGDAERLGRAVAAHLEFHEEQALRGEWRNNHQAFIDFQSLALVQLGRERGLSCNVSSPYLPVDLLPEG